MPPKKNNGDDLSDTDRVALEEWRAEREFERKLAERAVKRRESLKSWGHLVLAIVGVLTIGKDAIAWVVTHIPILKQFFNGP